jgi:hypothetical protein
MLPRNRVLIRALLALVAVLCVPVLVVSCMKTLSCCAINPKDYPAAAAANKRRQGNAALLAVASTIVGTGALVAVARKGGPPGRAAPDA